MADLSSHELFAARLRKCVTLAGGSAYALAKKSGIPANTIRLYLKGSEPSRAKLVLLAKAAGVSASWLAFGEAGSSGPVPEADQTMGDHFRRRLHRWIDRYGGVEQAVAAVGIDRELLQRLVDGERITVQSLAPLASNSLIPIRWLISDGPGYQGRIAPEANAVIRELANGLAEVDDRRLYSGSPQLPDNIDRLSENADWKSNVYAAMVKLYEWLPPAYYELYEIGSAHPYEASSKGDLAIVDKQSHTPDSGWYLFKEGNDPGVSSSILMHVSRVGGVLRLLGGLELASDTLVIDESKFSCLGKVVTLIRRFSV